MFYLFVSLGHICGEKFLSTMHSRYPIHYSGHVSAPNPTDVTLVARLGYLDVASFLSKVHIWSGCSSQFLSPWATHKVRSGSYQSLLTSAGF